MRMKSLLAATALSLAAAAPAYAQSLEEIGNHEHISLNGTVTSVGPESFQLSYADGSVLVEMDEFAEYNSTFLKPGDRVTVSGEIDAGFYERTTLEAESVYVNALNTYFYADDDDEYRGYSAAPQALYAGDDDIVSLTGIVKGVGDDEFLLDTGYSEIRVDTDDVRQQLYLSKGDRVSVYGEMDDSDIFDGREIEATSVTILARR